MSAQPVDGLDGGHLFRKEIRDILGHVDLEGDVVVVRRERLRLGDGLGFVAGVGAGQVVDHEGLGAQRVLDPVIFVQGGDGRREGVVVVAVLVKNLGLDETSAVVLHREVGR